MYSDNFCNVYNLFGWNYFPEIFGEQLLRWMEENNFAPDSMLDLGCGTGVLCKILSEQGISSTGIDLSEGMIAIAKENDPVSHYEAADMVTYRAKTPVNLVTCTGDALNHIVILDDVESIFKNVFDSLTPGGYFVFDLLDEGEISTDEPFELPYSETVTARFLMFRTFGDNVELHVSVFENGKLQFEEVISETIHAPGIICAMLMMVGFELVSCSHKLLQNSEGEGTTWFIVARKPEGDPR